MDQYYPDIIKKLTQNTLIHYIRNGPILSRYN